MIAWDKRGNPYNINVRLNDIDERIKITMREFVTNLSAWLSSSPYSNLIFFVLAISSLIVSIILYYKARKLKIPVYLEKSYSLIKDSTASLEGLTIKYKEDEIRTLTLTHISFWNKGKETIDENDIAPADRLRLVLPEEGKVVDSKITFVRKQANNIRIEPQQNNIYINFDFLDYGDGAVFEIYHTCNAGHPITVVGTLKGAQKIGLGEYKDDFLLDRFLNPLFDLLPSASSKIGQSARFVLFVLMGLPFLFVLAPLEKIIQTFNHVPKEYEL